MDNLWDRMQLAFLRIENQKRYQVMIDYIKSAVGKGKAYTNSVARVVMSSRGCYYVLINLPEEFSGILGDRPHHELVSEKEAMCVLFDIIQLSRKVTPENTRELSLYVIYEPSPGLSAHDGIFVFHFSQVPERQSLTPLAVGMFDPSRTPLFFKVKLDTHLPQNLLSAHRGVLFSLRYKPNRFLLVDIPYEGQDLCDLGAVPINHYPT